MQTRNGAAVLVKGYVWHVCHVTMLLHLSNLTMCTVYFQCYWGVFFSLSAYSLPSQYQLLVANIHSVFSNIYSTYVAVLTRFALTSRRKQFLQIFVWFNRSFCNYILKLLYTIVYGNRTTFKRITYSWGARIYIIYYYTF